MVRTFFLQMFRVWNIFSTLKRLFNRSKQNEFIFKIDWWMSMIFSKNLFLFYFLFFLNSFSIAIQIATVWFTCFSLHFSGKRFRVRKLFSFTLNFKYTIFCGICSLFILCLKWLFRKCVTYVLQSFTKYLRVTHLK